MNIKDLETDLQGTSEEVKAKLEEKLGIKITDLREALEKYTQEHAADLGKDFITLAPYGDYGKLLEEENEIASFLKEEASLAKNWSLVYLEQADTRLVSEMLLEFVFINTAMDEDEALRGIVYIGAGKIKHVFVRNQ